jgi:hypothetical protein
MVERMTGIEIVNMGVVTLARLGSADASSSPLPLQRGYGRQDAEETMQSGAPIPPIHSFSIEV